MTAKRWVLVLAVLVLVVFVPYLQVYDFDFVNYDDDQYVSANSAVQMGFTSVAIKRTFTSTTASNWHPVTVISHMLDWKLFGSNAGAHHLISVMFHVINVLLLFLLLNVLTKSCLKSSAVALIFGIHPLHVESVAWISERKDVLSAFFFLLGLLAYSAYSKSENKKSVAKYYTLLVVSFLMALMSKPMMVTMPFVLLLLDYWPLERIDHKGEGACRRGAMLFVEKIPFFIMSAVICFVTYTVQSAKAVTSISQVPISVRIINAFHSYGVYIYKTFWPSKLSVFYPYRGGNLFSGCQVAMAVVLIAIVSALVFLFRERKYLVTGWLWYLGMLVPVIGLVQVGEQAYADRYMYVPMVGLLIIVVWFIVDFAKSKGWLRTLAVIATALALALTAVSYRQVSYWRNSETLFSHSLDVTDMNYVAHYNLARALEAKGDIGGALLHYNKTLMVDDSHSLALMALGNYHARAKRFSEAFVLYESAIKTKKIDHLVFCNYALAKMESGDLSKAEQLFMKAIDTSPLAAYNHYGLGVVYAEQGYLELAVKEWRLALKLDPGHVPSQNNLLRALTMIKGK